jgi:hypothetical protein
MWFLEPGVDVVRKGAPARQAWRAALLREFGCAEWLSESQR